MDVTRRAEELIQIFDPNVGGIGFGGPHRRFGHRMTDAEIAEIEAALPALGFENNIPRDWRLRCCTDGKFNGWEWFGWIRERPDSLYDVVIFEVPFAVPDTASNRGMADFTQYQTWGQVAIVDAEDFERLNQFKWQAHRIPDTQSFRAARNSSRKDGKRCLIYMHREVMKAPMGALVDHRHHNTLDNRKSQLRLANRSQSQCNRKIPTNNTSGFKGVSWYKAGEKWSAQIQIHGKQKHLGYFLSAEDAHEAYKVAAIELHGNFAKVA